jgi:hypothetical protein
MPLRLSENEQSLLRAARPRRPATLVSEASAFADAALSGCEIKCDATLALALRDAASSPGEAHAAMAGEAGMAASAWDGWAEDGRTPLIAAVERCWPEGVATLLGAGADPSRLSRDGRSPLDVAAELAVEHAGDPKSGRAEQIVTLLLLQGADPDAGLPSPLGGVTERISQDIKRHGDLSGDRPRLLRGDRFRLDDDDRGRAQRFASASELRGGVARRVSRLLLVFGANPNLPGLSGETPLAVACASDFCEFAHELLDAGADPAAANPRTGRTAVHELLDHVGGEVPPERRELLTRVAGAGGDLEAASKMGGSPVQMLLGQQALIETQAFANLVSVVDRARIDAEIRRHAQPKPEGAAGAPRARAARL